MEKTFNDLSISLEKEAELRSKIQSAFIYPIVLLFVATGIMIFLTTFALPKVAGVFQQSGITPPWFSQIVFTVGLFFGDNILIILPAAAIIIGALFWMVKKTDIGRRAFNRTLFRAFR